MKKKSLDRGMLLRSILFFALGYNAICSSIAIQINFQKNIVHESLHGIENKNDDRNNTGL